MLKIFKMILIIIGIVSRIAQRLTTFIADILDKITGENASPTPTSNAHNNQKTLSPHNHHPLPETIHTFATEFETKPHFREYVYTNTQRIFDIISLAINKIFTPKFATILGGSTILIIYGLRILDFYLPLSTIII